MRYPVGDWLQERFPDAILSDRVFAFGVFDHLVESLSTAGLREPGSPRGNLAIDTSGVQTSRVTFARAINAPIGKAAEGLIEALAKCKPEQSAGIPEDFKVRFERLLSTSGEGAADAVCVLSSRIAWLNWVDRSWVAAKMVPWFRRGHDCDEPAWNGILSSPKGSIQHVFDEIKGCFLDLPTRMYEWGWRIETERYYDEIVALTLLGERKLSFDEARCCLRLIKSAGREQVIWFLKLVGEEIDNGWRELVLPFIRKAWPNERRYRTGGTSSAWVALLCRTGDAFPDVLDAVRNHVGPVNWRQASLVDLEQLVGRFPQDTLDLLDRVAPDGVEEGPYGLATVLSLLIDADPTLTGDSRYSRLHRLAAQQ